MLYIYRCFPLHLLFIFVTGPSLHCLEGNSLECSIRLLSATHHALFFDLHPSMPDGVHGPFLYFNLKSTNPSAVIVRLYFSFYIVEVYAGSALILPKSLMLLYENLEAVMKSFQLSMNSWSHECIHSWCRCWHHLWWARINIWRLGSLWRRVIRFLDEWAGHVADHVAWLEYCSKRQRSIILPPWNT